MSTNLARDQRRGGRGIVASRQRMRQRQRIRPTLLALEERQLLSTFTVTNTLDDGSTGSLRYEIGLANTAGGANTIAFNTDPAQGTDFSTPQTITLAGSLLELSTANETETITGPAAGVTVSGGGLNEVFLVDKGVTASISGLTITGGQNGNAGGGLYNRGTVTLTDCTVSGNSASRGGGLLNVGTATLTDCTVSGNSASLGGGLVNGALTATLTLTNCTVSGNSGGGLFNIGGTATLTNCTVSGNSASRGGGLYNRGTATLTLTNCTVSGNSASRSGGGAYILGGTMTLGNSIVAGNTATTSGPDVFQNSANGAVITSWGNNLIGKTDGSIATDWGASDLTGTIATPLDPLLAALGNYGGPTQTMALLPGSPAINAGYNALAVDANNQPLLYDQRGPGYSRISGGTVDIGAFEVQVVTPTFSALTSPTIVYGTPTTTLTGNLGFGTVYPTGSSVSITLNSVTQTAVVDGSGNFTTTFDTASLGIAGSPYTVTYAFAGYSSFSAATDTSTTVTVTLPTAAAYVLNASQSGAVTASGNAAVSLSGGLFVDSTSSSAIKASGNAQVNVGGSVLVVGGVSKSGNASVGGVSSIPGFTDPLASLAPPVVPTGGAYSTAVAEILGGNATDTISPGYYSTIKVSGSASLTLNPGVYVIGSGGVGVSGNGILMLSSSGRSRLTDGVSFIIEGGGFAVSGNASISGTNAFIFNAGTGYTNNTNNGVAKPTDGGTFGGITLSGNGTFNVTAPGRRDRFDGILIYQARDNTRALSIGGNASLSTNGTIYAANAMLTLGGNGNLQDALVVNTLNVSGNVALTQLASGSDGAGDAPGIADSLLAGDLSVYINDPGGLFTADELARIQDAINTWDALLAPYNVTITQVTDPTLANMVIDIGSTSACGGAANGVLGCFNAPNAEITMIQDWNWYAGSDPTQIGANQYDFETTMLHELGHALGLGGGTDPTSPMYETLAPGVADRTVTTADLNIPDPPEDADPQTAVPIHLVTVAAPVFQNGLTVSSSVTTIGAAGQVPLPLAPAHLTFTQAPPAASMLNASSVDHGLITTSDVPRSLVQDAWSTALDQIEAKTGLKHSDVLPEPSRSTTDEVTPARFRPTQSAAEMALEELAAEQSLARVRFAAETTVVADLPWDGAADTLIAPDAVPLETFPGESAESKPWLTDLLFAAGLGSFGAGLLAVKMRRSRSRFVKKALFMVSP